jgi:hypothetical protein
MQLPQVHAGMSKKPLLAYSPDSARSRLPQPSTYIPNTFESQIEFGNFPNYVSHRTSYQIAHNSPKLLSGRKDNHAASERLLRVNLRSKKLR